MNGSIFIDKQTYKIMCYVYRHHEVKLSKIEEKFGREGISSLLLLVSSQYALYKTPDGLYTSDTTSIDSDGSIGLIPPGNVYIENRRQSFIQWFVPTFISLLALIASIASLLFSPNNSLQNIFFYFIQ